MDAEDGLRIDIRGSVPISMLSVPLEDVCVSRASLKFVAMMVMDPLWEPLSKLLPIRFSMIPHSVPISMMIHLGALDVYHPALALCELLMLCYH